MPFTAETFEPEGSDQHNDRDGEPLMKSLFSPIYKEGQTWGHPILKPPNTKFYCLSNNPTGAEHSTKKRGGLLTFAESRTLSLSCIRHADERLSSILCPGYEIRVRGPKCPARGHSLNVVMNRHSHRIPSFSAVCQLLFSCSQANISFFFIKVQAITSIFAASLTRTIA